MIWKIQIYNQIELNYVFCLNFQRFWGIFSDISKIFQDFIEISEEFSGFLRILLQF